MMDTSDRVLKDTFYTIDTVITSSNDTIIKIDTVVQVRRDTIFSVDTLVVVTRDTVISALDTLVVHDSTLVVTRIVSYDTQYLALDTLTLVNQKALNLSGSVGELDLSFLESLSQLEWLNLTGVQSESFAPLAYCTNLRYLYLGGASIEDVSDIRLLTKLLHLTLPRISTADPLDLMLYPDIEYFRADCSNLDSIVPFQGLTKLETLYLDGENNNLLTLLEELPALKKVVLTGIKKDVVLKDLPVLSETFLSGSARDVVFENLPLLEEVDLPETAGKVILDSLPLIDGTINYPFKTLSQILFNDLPELDTLIIPGGICSLMTLTNMEDLQHLKILNRDTSYSPQIAANNLPNLTSCILQTSNPEKCVWLSELTSLTSLKIGLSTLDDMDADWLLRKMPTMLTDLSSLNNLRRLDLCGNSSLEDISGINGLTSLTFVDIYGCNQIKDHAPLHSCLGEGDTLTACIFHDGNSSNEWPTLSVDDVAEFKERGVIVFQPVVTVY